jgi:hypothetical protein
MAEIECRFEALVGEKRAQMNANLGVKHTRQARAKLCPKKLSEHLLKFSKSDL